MFLRWLTFASAFAFGCAVPSAGRADANIPVHDGLWSLELGVQNLSGSGSFLGLSARHHLTDRSAIRLGVAGRVGTTDGYQTQKDGTSNPDTSISVESRFDESTDEREVILLAHWVRYHGLDESFGMTLEAGPTVHWRSEESLNQLRLPLPPGSDEHASMQDRNLWEYGLDLQMGFEWFFSRQVSLATRFGIAALRTEERRSYDDFASSDLLDYTIRIHDEAHFDGYVVRTTFPLVSLNASW
jgi:hypothetical protein